MTMRVTMRENRRSEDGLSILLTGQTYTVSDDYGRMLVLTRGNLDADNAIATEAAANRDDLLASEARLARGLVSKAGITADDTGSAWAACPKLLSLSAVLAAGSSTTVLIEVRDALGTVTTAATIVADTLAQVLRQAWLTKDAVDFRIRRSSGTGSVTVTV